VSRLLAEREKTVKPKIWVRHVAIVAHGFLDAPHAQIFTFADRRYPSSTMSLVKSHLCTTKVIVHRLRSLSCLPSRLGWQVMAMVAEGRGRRHGDAGLGGRKIKRMTRRKIRRLCGCRRSDAIRGMHIWTLSPPLLPLSLSSL
jgi:hypothetical protein